MIKKITLQLLVLSLIIAFNSSFAQVYESNFESLTVPSVGYWNGSTNPNMSTGFNNEACYFNTYYNSGFGGYWESGFAYSNTIDTVTPSIPNLYGCAAGKGFGGSNNYAMGQQNSIVKINSINTPHTKSVEGFYVTNSYYAYASMKYGDTFETAFGDSSGNRPDYFRLVVRAYLNGTIKSDSVIFYLADYRFVNSSQDYIIKNWTWVNCQSLGAVDSVKFEMQSSRVGAFGINTPLFFAIDNFTVKYNSTSSLAENKESDFQFYPNPAVNELFLKMSESEGATYSISNISGQKIVEATPFYEIANIDVSGYSKGIYFIEVTTKRDKLIHRFIKN